MTTSANRPRSMVSEAGRTRISRILHGVGDLTANAWVAAGVAMAVGIFLIALAVAGFPSAWQSAFATVAAAVTLMMVFVIQHTQSRQQKATQLKLDELIRTSPVASDKLVHIESAEEAELIRREQEQIDHHAAIRAN